MMKRAVAVLIVVMCALSGYAAAGGDYVIFRANVNPLYIAGESVFIQVFALVFQNGKPTDQSATVDITMKEIGGNYSYHEEVQISGGRTRNVNLPALDEGHYRMTLYAEKHGIRSQTISFEFGVSQAPVPYEIYFNQDGSKVHFRSGRLDETGNFDEKYPFTLQIWYSQYGSEDVPVKVIKNVTHADVTIPLSVRQLLGVVYVDVIDVYGWKNSDSMDLSSFSFTGVPISYAYGYQHMEPWSSRTLPRIIMALAIILILFAIIFYVGTRKREVV